MFFQRFMLNYLFMRDFAAIIDIYRHKNIQSSIIYHCYDAQTTVQMIKMFSMNSFRISSSEIEENITKSLISLNDINRLGIIVNTSCDGWINILDFTDARTLKSTFVWVIVTDNLTETVEILSLFKIELDSDVTIITKDRNIYVLYEVYHTGFNRNGQFIVRDIGKWNGSLQIIEIDRKDLEGLVLKTAVVLLVSQKVVNKTYVRYLDEAQPHLIKGDTVHKFKGYAVTNYLANMFNITLQLVRTKSWGYSVNGTYDGLVGALQRKEVELGGSPIFYRTDRLNVLNYIAVAWLTKLDFIFRHPKHLGGFYTIYTRPLDYKVWWCIIAFMVVSAVVLAGSLLHLKMHRPLELHGEDGDLSPSFAFLFIWSAICQQGLSVGRSTISMKLVMFTTFIFGVTIYQYYSATVVSTLLSEPPKNIKTLEDLSKSNLKAGVEDIIYNKDYFKRTTDPIAREIYLKKVVNTNPPKYFSLEKGLAMVKKGGFAFHVESSVAYKIVRRTFTEKEICDLQEVTVFAPYVALAVAKGSPYKDIMAYGTQRMKESGIWHRLVLLWDEVRPPCVRTPDASMISVNILEFSTALAALALGYCAGLVLLAAELMLARLGRRHMIEFTH